MVEPVASVESPAPVRGYMDGCFDIMHSGHYNAIRQAKKICDVLVVGVHSDDEIKANKAVPVMCEAERYAILDHIKWIDEIIYDVPYSPQLATLDRARADFCVHGDDLPVNANGVGAYDEMKNAGRLRIIKRTEGVSTTDLIGRLLTLSRHQHQIETTANSLGVSITPDAVFDEIHSGPTSVKAIFDAVDDLSKKYDMKVHDVQHLKDQIGAHIRDEFANSTGTMRTNVPVQLLASTRRISEFSSSRQPSQEDRVVYVSGSFDMFHVGHACFLKDAKALGSFLLVGIQEDNVVSRRHGVNLPVMSLNERVLNVCACKWVDEVLIGAPSDVSADLLKTWKIHVVARGADHMRDVDPEHVDNRYTLPRKHGIYVEVPSKWPQLCHETIVQRIISSREVYLQRNKVRARREDEYYSSKKTLDEH